MTVISFLRQNLRPKSARDERVRHRPRYHPASSRSRPQEERHEQINIRQTPSFAIITVCLLSVVRQSRRKLRTGSKEKDTQLTVES